MQLSTQRKPGEKGTRKLQREYGNRLVCVRYRYDPLRRRSYKTIELIIDERDWQPPGGKPASSASPYGPDSCAVRIGYHETALREAVKNAGGIWAAGERAWLVDRGVVDMLGLRDRVIG